MGFDLLEYVKKSNYENTALIAPAGYGKTQFLLKCFEALKSENGVVPCYIDAAALNTKDLYTELQKYFFKDEKSYLGSIEFFKRFYNMVSAQSEIKYVLLINHYEDAFNNESIADVINIIENFVKMGCCVIVSSAFNDGKVFENFKVLKLEPHSKEKIISILEDKFKDSPKFDFKNLKEQVYSIISTPLMLGWYIELIKTNPANDVMINSEHQLMDRRFNDALDNDFVLKFAYYCTEHKTKYIAEKELVELLLAHNGKVRLVSRIFGKKHINDFEADALMLEKYGIAKYEKSSQKLVFSNQICIDYFAAKKIGRDVNNNNFDVFDEFIFSEQICKFLSYEIDKRSLLAELDSMQANQSGNVNRCFESCDDIVKTTNLVNILYFYKNSFKDCDLHSLDLRLCNFIGKECVNTDFSNSLCNDACFVPFEGERDYARSVRKKAELFAISGDGKYFATGDENAVNIWDVKYSTVIHRVLSDESSPFTDIGYKKDTGFVISANSELYSSVIVKIKNGIISQSLNYDKNIVLSCIEKSKKNSVDKFDSYGTLCCKQENFVLLRSDENSYYGNAYLLFDTENEKSLSVCKVSQHLLAEEIVQDGDEIEILFSGRPLKSICFNDSTKEMYRKKYPSLNNRVIQDSNDRNILCDCPSNFAYERWYFNKTRSQSYKGQLTSFNLRQIATRQIIHFNHGIITKNEPICLIGNNLVLCFNCELFGDNTIIGFKAMDDRCFYGYGNNKLYIYDSNYKVLNLFDIHEKYNIKFGCSYEQINIIKLENRTFLVIGNSIFKVIFNEESKKIELEFIKKFELTFKKEYLHTIESFPWSKMMNEFWSSHLYSNYFNDIPYYFNGNAFRKDTIGFLLRVKIRKFLKNNKLYAFNSSMINVFANYMTELFLDFKNVPCYDNKDYIEGMKDFCNVCDDGIIYYNGQTSCYVSLDDNLNEANKVEYNNGVLENICRYGVHYDYNEHLYDVTNHYQLFDIHKSYGQNKTEQLIIPIYDLNLYNANIDCILGISAVVKDIIQKQTEIYTKYLTFDD